MKNIKKIFIISMIGLLAHAPYAAAHSETDDAIKVAIESKLSKIQGIDNAALITALADLKIQIAAIIAASPEVSKYTALQTALGRLNPEALITNIAHFKVILQNIPAESRTLILAKIPTAYHAFIK